KTLVHVCERGCLGPGCREGHPAQRGPA
ncbi:hypothetical protein BN1708_018769, partial [Verticillium longisporum]